MPCVDHARQCQKRGSAGRRRAASGRREADAVAAAAHGLDAPRPRRVVLDLAAQVPDVDVEEPLVAVEALASQREGEARAGLDVPGMLGQREEKVESV